MTAYDNYGAPDDGGVKSKLLTWTPDLSLSFSFLSIPGSFILHKMVEFVAPDVTEY